MECLNCNKELEGKQTKYCSNKCKVIKFYYDNPTKFKSEEFLEKRRIYLKNWRKEQPELVVALCKEHHTEVHQSVL